MDVVTRRTGHARRDHQLGANVVMLNAVTRAPAAPSAGQLVVPLALLDAWSGTLPAAMAAL